ncbi:hypothetical protein G6F56_003338 [Rhizopus delemar]|uniref:Zn(2)-C6 fungal-type domain-containing protein n=1 Tax=Rhizopus stolonifer TaxID=4846 RepID=A0A367KR26_RHIST|nr:hypothetical protein G6F56_003338 [Rhizopus delemar]RCI04653.1 hypothetical protein CU098_007080 [Rhizopus stolonifer]
MDTPVIYSQLINFGDSDSESSDETPDICASPMNIKPFTLSNEYESTDNLYDALDSYNKTYLSYLQPYGAEQLMLYPQQNPIFETPLVSNAQLEFDNEEPLQKTMVGQQKERFSWLFHDPLDTNIPSSQPDQAKAYVNLSDVNSYVAKIDSVKYSTAFPYNDPPPVHQPDFLPDTSYQESEEEEEEEDNMFSDSSEEDDWPFCDLASSNDANHSIDKKPTIKIKKPMLLNSLGDSIYPDWATALSNLPPALPLSAYRKYKKSAPNIQTTVCKKPKTNSLRRGSVPSNIIKKGPNNLSTTASSSSLSSLSNNMKKTMKVSDSLNSLATQEEEEPEENTENLCEESEDDEDDEGQASSKKKAKNAAALLKKGKNVDKACNHCKRSHLRCDEMRPCRRCITTGKIGCRDVQHKPRGRPKLPKNLE